jgi:hypothetical protein
MFHLRFAGPSATRVNYNAPRQPDYMCEAFLYPSHPTGAGEARMTQDQSLPNGPDLAAGVPLTDLANGKLAVMLARKKS